jgi:hypothetical protein
MILDQALSGIRCICHNKGENGKRRSVSKREGTVENLINSTLSRRGIITKILLSTRSDGHKPPDREFVVDPAMTARPPLREDIARHPTPNDTDRQPSSRVRQERFSRNLMLR